MSISSALSSAVSGLNASARAAELVSSNIANALTEGYARRELQLGARSVGGNGQGVAVTGVTRIVDQVLTSDRRNAEASADGQSLRAEFLQQMESVIGTPESEGSLTGRIAALETALIQAASHPESEARLSGVAAAAQSVVTLLHRVSDAAQAARSTADQKIAADVAQVNQSLLKIAALNSQIRTQIGSGRDTSALMDQRQHLVDGIASVIPVRELARGNGQIALYTSGGAALLDGRPAELGFTPVGVVVPQMTAAAGGLSGLTLNGRAIATAGRDSPIAGGTLAARFALRDEMAPELQTRLDAVARDLIERFAAPSPDPTLVPGDPGLFTDAGAAFLPAGEVGLAQRITLNAAVDPGQGGQLYRIRDGIGATAPGVVGDSRLLWALQGAMTASSATASGGFMPYARSFAALGADLLSSVASDRLSADSDASYAVARAQALKVLELENGVDSDDELQKLLLIEQAYAANARVIQTVDDMIQTLLGI